MDDLARTELATPDESPASSELATGRYVDLHDLATLPGTTALHDAPTVAGPPLVEHAGDFTLAFVRARGEGASRSIIDNRAEAQLRSAFARGRVLQERYALERELGRGGMGVVYLGRDTRLGRPVAIKVILAEGDGVDANLRDSFAEEARLGANLTHPAIATVFDYGFHEGNPFTVFEYIPGQTLRDVLRTRSRLPLDEARMIVGVLAQALDFAHERHVVHRDLKPENIRATEQGQYKVLDLGLAKDFHSHEDWTFCGTPSYASPEQAAAQPCDGRTDQYALAVIAFELLTGRRPFESHDWITLLDMHVNQAPPSPQSIRPDLPDAVAAALARALEKDPNRRYASCTEFAVALGCQLLSAPAPLPEILLETDCKKMWGRWKSFYSPFSLSTLSPRVHVTLAPDALWATYRSELMRWPLTNIGRVTRWGRNLTLMLEGVRGKKKQVFRMNSRSECRSWHDRIQSLVRTKVAADSDELAPTIPATLDDKKLDPIVLLKKRPASRFQLLGSVEVKAHKARLARTALAIRGAMMGADAVVDLEEERLVGYGQTAYRAVGTAVRAVDQDGRLELKARWFDSQVRALRVGMLVLATLGLLSTWLSLAIGVDRADLPDWYQPFQLKGEAVAALWLLAVTLGFSQLRWPQLAKPAAICFLGLAAAGILSVAATLSGIFTADQPFGEALRVAVAFARVVVFFSLYWFYYFLGRRAWTINREYAQLTIGGQRQVSPARLVFGRIALAGSTVFVLWTLTMSAWTSYHSSQEINRPDFGGLPIHDGIAESSVRIVQARVALTKAERRLKFVPDSVTRKTEWSHAQNKLARALALDPKHEARKPDEAISLSKSLVERHPKEDKYWTTLGAAYYSAGQYDASIEALNQAIVLHESGGTVEDWFLFAANLARKGDRTQGGIWFGRAINELAAHPTTDRILSQLVADAYHSLRNPPASPEPSPPTRGATPSATGKNP
jgi:serine/threonine protein kinase/tetratricopeptide (TPR) repeat protein